MHEDHFIVRCQDRVELLMTNRRQLGNVPTITLIHWHVDCPQSALWKRWGRKENRWKEARTGTAHILLLPVLGQIRRTLSKLFSYLGSDKLSKNDLSWGRNMNMLMIVLLSANFSISRNVTFKLPHKCVVTWTTWYLFKKTNQQKEQLFWIRLYYNIMIIIIIMSWTEKSKQTIFRLI